MRLMNSDASSPARSDIGRTRIAPASTLSMSDLTDFPGEIENDCVVFDPATGTWAGSALFEP